MSRDEFAMKRSEPNSAAWRLRAPVLIGAGAWVFVVVIFTLQAMHTDSSAAVRITLRRSAMWVVFAPLAVWLGFRFQFVRPKLARSLAAHLAACVLLIAVSHLTLSEIGSEALSPSLRSYREIRKET